MGASPVRSPTKFSLRKFMDPCAASCMAPGYLTGRWARRNGGTKPTFRTHSEEIVKS